MNTKHTFFIQYSFCIDSQKTSWDDKKIEDNIRPLLGKTSLTVKSSVYLDVDSILQIFRKPNVL